MGRRRRVRQAVVTAIARTDPAREQAKRQSDERIDHVTHMMAMGEWSGARSTRELAETWGVSMHCVSEYARVASAIIRRVTKGDPEDVRAEVIAGIERLRLIATEHSRRDVRGVTAALSAYDLRAKLLGLFPAQKIELVTPDAWNALSLEEKRERLTKAKVRIAQLEAELVAAECKQPVDSGR
jgi:hypothetical protein